VSKVSVIEEIHGGGLGPQGLSSHEDIRLGNDVCVGLWSDSVCV
jgi:hypothetical protein